MPRITVSDDEFKILQPVLEDYRRQKELVTHYNAGVREAASVIMNQLPDGPDRDSLLSDINLLIREFP